MTALEKYADEISDFIVKSEDLVDEVMDVLEYEEDLDSAMYTVMDRYEFFVEFANEVAKQFAEKMGIDY